MANLPVPQAMGAQNPLGTPVSPENFLMAAADLHQKGEFQSAPVPKGTALQNPMKRPSRRPLQVVK